MTVPVMAADPRYEGAAVVGTVAYAVPELGAKAIEIFPPTTTTVPMTGSSAGRFTFYGLE